ncbi:MAG: 3-phosphoshikimate 1-carboxyvinyltransferase [Oscillospiraceae bacterium]|nr:3-phosphoshikimate 1-carboxyvinyltransferase [Oscillospiraceae bacterium]
MKLLIPRGPRSGSVRIPASKSRAHRLLICAALSREETLLRCEGFSRDIEATVRCLQALGAEIEEEQGLLRVTPIQEAPAGECLLPCGECGATLRLLLPVIGALGVRACFSREGRLPRRPLAPLDRELTEHGMYLEEQGALLYASGKLRAGEFRLPGNVSSQYISGLLLALPLLEGESRLQVTEPVESEAYIRMTEEVLDLAGLRFAKEHKSYVVPGGQRPGLSGALTVEGDWSSAAFFLCAGALSEEGVLVKGLDLGSTQGDRAVLELLRGFGAEVSETEDGVLCRRGELRGQEIDAGPIPDLIPVLSVLAAGARGVTRIRNAGRLRLKESDRLRTTADLLRDLGGSAEELEDGLVIRGSGALRGGRAKSAGDHRIAMSAAVAACLCGEPVTLDGAECVEKSYPRFWEDWQALEVRER